MSVELYGKVYDKPLTDEEFEEIWKKMKEEDEEWNKKYDALPEEEKKRREELCNTPFGKRMTEEIYFTTLQSDEK